MARPPAAPSTLDPDAFRAVAIAGSVADSTVPPPSIDAVDAISPAQIGDFPEEQDRSFEPRANPRQPARAESVLKPTPKPKPKPQPQAAPKPPPNPTHSVRGSASWYCKPGVSACHNGYSGGLYAAAGPALRVGNWRGRTVSVCGSGNCVNVKLIDSCWCASGRVIDLYSDAFRRLAPTSVGTISVRVSW